MASGESGEMWYAYHAYHTAGLTPEAFASLPKRERAMIMAFTDIRIEAEEKAMKKPKKG
ncbi:hypothetical protein [Enterococcus casseliflavus]|uniref:hypothetical protein n=1 Tax=Enterococcus casseliflavus TaxID=37734 RepID=UPI001BCD80AF|nr:hypothetical protein [Enterococcus casseliflavus]